MTNLKVQTNPKNSLKREEEGEKLLFFSVLKSSKYSAPKRPREETQKESL